MKFYITVFCLMLFLVLPFSTSFAQLNWTKDLNPVLTGVLSTWNQDITMSSVLYNVDSARYEMWFCGGPGIKGQHNDWRPLHIGYAFSEDGISWTMHALPVLDTTSGKWDEGTVECPSVIREDGIYKMWYTGWNYTENPDSVQGIGYATSLDGITWTKYPSIVLRPDTNESETAFPYSCSVMHDSSQGYKMWYGGTDWYYSEFDIGYATSDDGITWQRDTVNNPVLKVGSPGSWDDYAVACPHVHRIDSTYYMWYTGMNTTPIRKGGLAFSDDGIHWRKYDDPATTSDSYAESDPVLKPSPGRWDGSQVESGSVLIFGDTLHMWYDGWLSPKPPNQGQIGHTIMPLDTLRKYTTITGIKVLNENLPNGYVLQQNYPNPFNPTTTIDFSLPKSEFVTLKIYNILGEEVATLVSEKLNVGKYKYEWDAGKLASGVYLYRIQAGSFIESKKLLLLK